MVLVTCTTVTSANSGAELENNPVRAQPQYALVCHLHLMVPRRVCPVDVSDTWECAMSPSIYKRMLADGVAQGMAHL